MMAEGATFARFGPDIPASPVILSVCHAGRAYPEGLAANLRVPVSTLARLEDRHADALIAPLVDAGASAIVAQVPRALIDLNRDERDIDPRMVEGLPRHHSLIESAKQRGGLGLFPRSLPGCGDLWATRISFAEARRRIEQMHRHYHNGLAEMIDAAVRAHGCALLLDIHSMPPLKPGRMGEAVPEMVVGDRFGQSASAQLSATAQAVLGGRGYAVSLNHPYPGSHLLERHGNPARRRHALQIEISRALYLDGRQDKPVPAIRDVQDSLIALVQALIEDVTNDRWLDAAE